MSLALVAGIRTALAEERKRAAALVRSDEVSFLPAAMEIVERPVSPTGRATAWLLLVGLGLTLLWLTLGRIDVVASATGELIPLANVQLIQPAAAGVVRSIRVRDGQHVRAGETLVELDPTLSTAEADQARKALETAELDAARARAILGALDGHGFAVGSPPGTPPQVAATQASLARAQFAEIEAQASGHSADRQAALAAKGEADLASAKLAETLPLLDQQVAANEALLAKGYVSKLKVIEMRRQRLAAARDRDIALETARKASAQAAAAGSSLAQSRAEARAKVLTDLTKADADAHQQRQELTKAERRSGLQRLASPVDGTIAKLDVHTIGGVVEAGKPIMVVVPSNGPLIAEVKLLNRDAGFVRVGQPVVLKLEAFPFTRYGTVAGQVAGVSSDAVEDQKLGLVYVVRIAVASRSPGESGLRRAIAPGMVVTADIRTGRRSILSYLVSPIDQTRQEAGRER